MLVWPSPGLVGRVMRRADLRPVQEEDVKEAISRKPTELLVAVKNLERVQTWAEGTGVLISGSNSTALCEIIVVQKDTLYKPPTPVVRIPAHTPTTAAAVVEDITPPVADTPRTRVGHRKNKDKYVDVLTTEIFQLQRSGLNSKAIVKAYRKRRLRLNRQQVEDTLAGKRKSVVLHAFILPPLEKRGRKPKREAEATTHTPTAIVGWQCPICQKALQRPGRHPASHK